MFKLRRAGAAAAMAALLLVLSPAADPGLQAEEARSFAYAADPALEESGLLRHLLVRFMLKTGRRGAPGDPPDLTLTTGGGTPAIARGGTVWRLSLTGDNDAAARFADWLGGEVGRATLAAYAPPEGKPFTAPEAEEEAAEEIVFDGDPKAGARLAKAHCGRCHATGAAGGYGNLANTPSFAALRALPDWADRFMAFYALNPHPAIMQVEGVTPPFDPDRPPAMIPVEITLEEAEAIQAYAATVPAADLGAPVAAR